MPVATPNRVADPVSLEAFVAPTVVRQEGGLFIPYFNASTTESILAGEPVIHAGRVCIAQRTILPQKMGTLLESWIVDALLALDHSGDINQNDLIYWDLDKDAVTPIEGGAAVDGIGAATAAQPTNGFILGRASGPHYEHEVPVDGSDDMVCATTGSKRVRVVCLPGAPTTYGS
jgi:hypothetical protein